MNVMAPFHKETPIHTAYRHLSTFTCYIYQVGDKEVCGCPLVADVFKDTGEYCPLPKRKCTKHHNWEKLRRAEIDLERVRWVRNLSTSSFNPRKFGLFGSSSDEAGGGGGHHGSWPPY